MVHGNLVVPVTVIHQFFLPMVHGYFHVSNVTVKQILKNTHVRNVTVKKILKNSHGPFSKKVHGWKFSCTL